MLSSILAPYTSCVYCTGATTLAAPDADGDAEAPADELLSKVYFAILAIYMPPKVAVAAVWIAPNIKEAGAGNAIEEVQAAIIPLNIDIIA
jgi:hypothetical protein